ncbi:hypothetical protein P7K49_021854 [Saguinus oedipus]|uniref:EGF-like domain-containing protein n=1 Tax=Saguinus oedipus TaxID=9490 RepID=A0ABQ9UUK6_SAGOE|nr:hypothetical protein P7K49_021854 [Saguinus oedipus]
MIQYLSRRDSIRQRSMRYQQNRLRSSTSSSSSDNQGPSVEGTDLEFEDFDQADTCSEICSPVDITVFPAPGSIQGSTLNLVPPVGILHSKELNRTCCLYGGTCMLGSFCACLPSFYGWNCEHDVCKKNYGSVPHDTWLPKKCSLCKCWHGQFRCFSQTFLPGCDGLVMDEHLMASRTPELPPERERETREKQTANSHTERKAALALSERIQKDAIQERKSIIIHQLYTVKRTAAFSAFCCKSIIYKDPSQSPLSLRSNDNLTVWSGLRQQSLKAGEPLDLAVENRQLCNVVLDNGDRSRHRAPRNARMSAPSLGRFVPRRFLLPEYLPYAGIFHERGQPGLATHSSVNRVLAVHISPLLWYCQHMEFPGTVESSEEGEEGDTLGAGSEIPTEQKMG